MNTITSDYMDVEYTDHLAEQWRREYETKVKLAGNMHVTQMNTVGLEHLQMDLMGLPKGTSVSMAMHRMSPSPPSKPPPHHAHVPSCASFAGAFT